MKAIFEARENQLLITRQILTQQRLTPSILYGKFHILMFNVTIMKCSDQKANLTKIVFSTLKIENGENKTTLSGSNITTTRDSTFCRLLVSKIQTSILSHLAVIINWPVAVLSWFGGFVIAMMIIVASLTVRRLIEFHLVLCFREQSCRRWLPWLGRGAWSNNLVTLVR